MKVKCIANSGHNLSTKALQAGHLKTTDFQLNIGEESSVYGISIWKGIIHYLTFDNHNTLPFWNPADLFVVTEPLLPLEWYFQYYGEQDNNNLSAIWGYKELVEGTNHYTSLIEREDKAIQIFLNRKKEIDEFMSY